MKNILGLVIFIFACVNVQAQFPIYPTVKQSLGSKSTEVYSKGILRADSGYVQSVFPDTIEANRGYIKNIAGITIRCSDTVYFRNAATTKWIQLSSGSGVTSTPNLDQVTTVGGSTFNEVKTGFLHVNTQGIPDRYGILNADLLTADRDYNMPDTSGTIALFGGASTVNYLQKKGSKLLVNSQIFDDGTYVGIGTASPSEKLHIAGNLRLVNGSQANGYILQSDVNGVSTWVNPTSITTAIPNLQQVTDVGSTTTNSIEVDGLTVNGPALFRSDTKLGETGAGIAATFNSTGNAEGGILLTNNITTSQSQLEFPDASGTIPVTVNGVAANTSGEITIPVGTGTVTGTGTTNTMTKWTSSTAIGNATSTDDGTTVTQTIKNLFTVNGALSAPAITGNGTWITGGSATTTKPYLLIEPAGTTSTGWSTAGTGLGVNAASSFTGNLIETQLNGSSKFKVDYTGGVHSITGTYYGINDFSSIIVGHNGFGRATLSGIEHYKAQHGSLHFSYTNTASASNYFAKFDIETGVVMSMAATSGTIQGVAINTFSSFAPTSGTAVYNHLDLTPTINQTGGASGITRGLYINPTLTAAADFRAIEVASGNSVFGTTSGNVGIGITTGTRTLNTKGVAGFYDAAGTEQLYISATSDGIDIAGGGRIKFDTRTGVGATTSYLMTSNFGIGTTSPAAKLDIVGGTSDGISLLISDNKTNATAKGSFIGAAHYLNAEEPVTMIGHYNYSGGNALLIGGGEATGNAATILAFYTGPNYNTLSGTERMRIDQTGAIGIGTSSPNASSIMDVSSTTKGVLIPRGSPANYSAISSPATGLLFYNNINSKLLHYNGSGWVPFLDSLTTGFIKNQTGVQSSANFNIDGAGVAGTTLTAPSLIANTASGTNRNAALSTLNLLDDASFATLRTSSGTNTSSFLSLIPRGTGSGSFSMASGLYLYATDVVADNTNTESLSIFANDGSDYVINSNATGTGTARPITISALASGITLGTSLNFTGIVEYADNAAAIIGGLSTGSVYRTGDLLKIVH